jgi:hypothetical protein
VGLFHRRHSLCHQLDCASFPRDGRAVSLGRRTSRATRASAATHCRSSHLRVSREATGGPQDIASHHASGAMSRRDAGPRDSQLASHPWELVCLHPCQSGGRASPTSPPVSARGEAARLPPQPPCARPHLPLPRRPRRQPCGSPAETSRTLARPWPALLALPAASTSTASITTSPYAYTFIYCIFVCLIWCGNLSCLSLILSHTIWLCIGN